MTERSQVLCRFGYTLREAQFLRLAALLGGYFVAGQFNRFIQRKSGALGKAFVDRTTSLGHAHKVHSDGNRHVYQVTRTSVYQALGDENNRNRRQHQPGMVRRRLMALDYCVAHQGNYLLTEREKVAHFQALGVAKEQLPSECFGSETKRFFVDKHPIEVRSNSEVIFVFVDDGYQGMSAWNTFLKSHRELMRSLSGASVIFASADNIRFLRAERAFNQVITGEVRSGVVDRNRLERYFTAKRKFEARDFGSFDQTSLDRLREDRKVFAGDEIEKRYRQWLVAGEPALEDVQRPSILLKCSVLPNHYGWLRPFQIHERRVSNALDFFSAKTNS